MFGLSRPVYQPAGGVAGQPRDRLDRARQVLALGRLVDVLVADPAPAVRRDLVAVAQEGLDHRRVPLERHRDAEHRERHLALAEQAQEPPHARARAVLVERLHAHVARAERLGADDVREEGLRGRVAVDHGVLGAFLVVEDELQRDARAARPAGVRRMLAVAGEVAGVGRVGSHRAAGSARWVSSIRLRGTRPASCPWTREKSGAAATSGMIPLPPIGDARGGRSAASKRRRERTARAPTPFPASP